MVHFGGVFGGINSVQVFGEKKVEEEEEEAWRPPRVGGHGTPHPQARESAEEARPASQACG